MELRTKGKYERKKRRIYKRIVILAGGIISFIFVSGKAVPKKQDTHNLSRKKISKSQLLNKRLIEEEVKKHIPLISTEVVPYETDRYSRRRWKRFISTNNPLGHNRQNDTDVFEVNVAGKAVQGVTVQTLASGRVAHSRLYGEGAVMRDGNGFEIKFESMEEGKCRFSVNGLKARAALNEIYFKFANGCEVTGTENTSEIIRTRIR